VCATARWRVWSAGDPVPLPFPDAGLTDGTLTVRPWRRDDLDALVRACQDPEIPRWTSVPSPYTSATGTWFLDQCDAWWDAGTDLPMAIVDAGNDVLLGATGIHRIGADVDAPGLDGLADEVGYWLAAGARGRGVVTRGVMLLTRWCSATLDRPTLWLRAHPDNLRSLAVARRCGFRDTGTTMHDDADPTVPLLVFRRDRDDPLGVDGLS
jgi:RimJ/RimL family protein N-acetyltransferase